MTWIRELISPGRRQWEQLYRNRWQHDAVVRSTHGVNCTGGCSWWVYVKEGIVTWELQATDYPKLEGVPPYEPRGCQRGISFSWYVYSPLRVKHPYVRGALLDAWRRARAEKADPIEAWAALVEDEARRSAWQAARGKGGLRRASWDECLELIAASLLHTARRYGPDRVVGFSPIPAMSMLSYAAGSRFLQLFGAPLLSFYDLYADFPPASPETWGEKTDVSEAADWFNARYIVTVGSNLSMTRTPDVHFAVEARHDGAKLVVLSPDFNQVSKYADWWIPVHAGMDGAFFMAVNHVLVREFLVDRTVPYFADYLARFTDAPFLVELEPEGGEGEDHVLGRFLRANRLARYAAVDSGEWKLLVLDAKSGEPRMPQGAIGFRWQERKGQWNLDPKDGLDGAAIEPQLSLPAQAAGLVQVRFFDHGRGVAYRRPVPTRVVETSGGPVIVTTVFDLLSAELGVARDGSPPRYDDEDAPFTPAWQERFTGIDRATVVQFAREWAATAEKTRGRCTIIIGSGANHWFHANLIYRSCITSLLLCGCVGRNGGGLNHYTGQEKVAPAASWVSLAMALDWGGPPRLQNGPSFHYVHSDQWRYERRVSDVKPARGPFAREHTLDHQVDAVRRGWLPSYPQFDASPIELVRRAEAAGARDETAVVRWLVEELRAKRVRFAVEDPDAPQNWPRVWLIWRANALLASAKGHEYFLRHYLGTTSTAVAPEEAKGHVAEALFREPAPTGKLDLVVDVNFRMDTSALYSDIVLPSATWYEKDDLNTTDLHSYIHPLGAAVAPCWESRTDWEIFRSLAAKVSELAPRVFPEPFRDIVATPLLHDTRDEIAQPRVEDWSRDECEPIPGRTMPHLRVVTRDYPNLIHRFSALGPRVREEGVEDRGIAMPVGDFYDELLRRGPVYEWKGVKYPSLVDPVNAADALLLLAPETNGEVAFRGFQAQERLVGLPLADLAASTRQVRSDFLALTQQPRRLLTSPSWSGIANDGRPYAAYCMNVERLVPWRTLSGRQHLYLDHEGYRAFGESLPTFKPRIACPERFAGSPTSGRALTLAYITPHGKWHIHSTYHDNLRMLTLSRGIEPFWLNDEDAAAIGVADDDWIEACNENGVVVTRAVVSARVPRGLCIYYHAPERTIEVPLSPLRGGHRAGGHNSLTRMRLKPLLMVGGYAQHCYRFNDYGPPATDRDTFVVVRRLEGAPRWD